MRSQDSLKVRRDLYGLLRAAIVILLFTPLFWYIDVQTEVAQDAIKARDAGNAESWTCVFWLMAHFWSGWFFVATLMVAVAWPDRSTSKRIWFFVKVFLSILFLVVCVVSSTLIGWNIGWNMGRQPFLDG